MPHHSTVISIVERVKQEIGRNRNFKKRIHELTRNLNKSQRQTPLDPFTLAIGIIVGTYSSIFVASPIVYIWKDSRM